MTRSSIRFMEQQVRDERPFYLQVSHYATHLGYQATADTIAELQGRKKGRRHDSVAYGSMIEELDRSLGNLFCRNGQELARTLISYLQQIMERIQPKIREM